MRPFNGPLSFSAMLLFGILAHSLTGIRFSRALKAGKPQISHLDAVQDFSWNKTRIMHGRSSLNAGRDGYPARAVPRVAGETFPAALTYKWLHPRYTKTRWASRTTRNSGGKGHGSAPSKAFGHPTPTIDLFTSLYLWKSLLTVGLICAILLMASLRGVFGAVDLLGKAWYDLSSDVEIFIVFVTERTSVTSWRLILRLVDTTVVSLTIQISKLLVSLSVIVCGVLEQVEIRQRKERHLASITRKAATSPTKFRRQYGKYSKTPLFRDDVHDKLTYLYLPEESNQRRHVCNPRHFNKVKKVGAGAFGSVYQIENRITGKMMAMKTLVRENNTNAEFTVEIRALVRLQDNVWFPKLSSTFMDTKNFYIIMPFYRRGDLYAYMTTCGGCLPRGMAKFYLAELFLAIQGLHRVGIIHRDLKPENILFSEEGHLIVADFGVAHVFDGEDNPDDFFDDEFPVWVEAEHLGGDEFPLLIASVDNPHSISGMAGTAYYSAPEVKSLEPYSYGVDYYSMAIIYHEMVTGFVPFRVGDPKPGTHDAELFLDLGRKDAHFQPISMTDSKFLRRMLNTDPYARPSVNEMKKDPVFSAIDWRKFAKQQVPIPPLQAMRKRVPISNSVERCLTPMD